MIPFSYQIGSLIKNGLIDIIEQDPTIEAEIQANGWSFHVIIGTHKNGNYICIPNWNIGSELGRLEDTFWNKERLENYTSLEEENSKIIAAALAKLSAPSTAIITYTDICTDILILHSSFCHFIYHLICYFNYY